MIKFINLVGVELEGGWDVSPEFPLIHDGSVNIPERVPFRGEVPSPPLPYGPVLKQWIKNNYPSHVNASCGFHIHVSFNSLLYYQVLMSKNFFDSFLKKAEKWGQENCSNFSPFWNRVEGGNRFCRPTYLPDEQAEAREKDDPRYSALNYCHALHGTIESRLMPMFPKAEQAFEAVKFTITTMREFLAKNVRQEARVSHEEEITIEEEETIQSETIAI